MTREHLINDIQNVLEMVRLAEMNPERSETTQNAVHTLFQHIRTEEDVPAAVEGCLEESVRSLDEAAGAIDARTWGYTRTCLESALEFALGEGPA